MTAIPYHITQPERPFARTNRQIINQRAGLLREWEYTRPTIAEICCGDCQRQQAIYRDVGDGHRLVQVGRWLTQISEFTRRKLREFFSLA